MTNFRKIVRTFDETSDGKCAEAEDGMVAAAFPEAAYAGVEMFEKGGNAVDAACATAFALGVCEPQASGIGGQTMALLHFADRGRTIAVDGSSRVPSLAHLSSVDANTVRVGYRATTVPSTPATLGYLWSRYGSLKWNNILEPSIRIAENGYKITELQSWLQKRETERFMEVPSKSGARYFLKNGEIPYEPGEKFVQKDLADFLTILSEKGFKEFYQGEIAKRIDADMRENGGLLRYDDLAYIPWPIERNVLKRRYRGITIATMPPPGSGRTLLFIMNMLENLPSKSLTEDTLRRYHLFAEVIRKALRERSDRPYDASFFPQVRRQKMLMKSYAHDLVSDIAEDIDPSLPIIETADERQGGETTHLSVMDKNGNAVSLTQSIERVYGSMAACDGLGFLYNNYMSDFEYEDPSHPYYLRPNAVPWATVAPSILFRRSKPWMALGSPGSERILSTLAQFIVHVIDDSASICEAVKRPRMHCSLGGKITLEKERFPDEIVDGLKQKGYRMSDMDSRTESFYLGAVHAVLKRLDGKGFQGIAEMRRDGASAGYTEESGN